MAVLAWHSAHGGTPRPVEILYLFGICFMLFGALLSGYTVKGIVLRRRIREEGGRQPWRFDYRWETNGSSDDGFTRVLKNAFAICGISLFLLPFHLLVRQDITAGQRPIFLLILGIFDLVMLIAVGRTIYLLVRRLIFGKTRVIFGQFPYYTGQPLHLIFAGTPKLAICQELKAQLHCIKEYYEWHGSGDDRTATPIMESLWRQECQFVTDISGRAELVFQLPTDLPGTDLIGDAKVKPPHYWELEVTATRSGIDYRGIFLIPIYEHG